MPTHRHPSRRHPSHRPGMHPDTRVRAGHALLFVLGLCAFAPALPAQDIRDSLKRTATRAAQSEVARKVDQETRRATRCVLGDERCRRDAEGRGQIIDVAGRCGVATSADAYRYVAIEGVRYSHAFTTAGVCAPCRSGIITGM